MSEELASRWTALRERGDPAAREFLVRRYIHLVRVTVGRIAVHLPAHIEEDDLLSAGALGLLGAVDRFDPARGVKFETFAITRIRGAILDELRKMDVLGRGTRERIVKIRAAERQLLGEGVEVNIGHLARRTGFSEDEILGAERAMLTANIASLDEVRDEDGHTAGSLIAEETPDPGAGLEREELRGIVDQILDEREKLVVALYYHEDLTLKEIGAVLEVTEGRVSQIHSALLRKLRWRLDRGAGAPQD